MFKGEHWCTLDEKGRLSFPTKFRDEIGQSFTITRWLGHCLVAFPTDQWNRIESILSGNSLVKGLEVKRMLYGGAVDVTMDKQGRVLIPPELRRRAKLEKDIVVLGVGQMIEIWNADILDALDQEQASDEIAKTMEDLGI